MRNIWLGLFELSQLSSTICCTEANGALWLICVFSWGTHMQRLKHLWAGRIGARGEFCVVFGQLVLQLDSGKEKWDAPLGSACLHFIRLLVWEVAKVGMRLLAGRLGWGRCCWMLLAADHCGCCSSFFAGGSAGYFSFICVLFVHCDLCPSLDASKKIQSLSAVGLLVASI
jgi:hypothetical protein